MIKVYCDKCGKEISGNVNQSVEYNEAKDALGVTLVVLPKIIHLCDECQYNELTCGFKVGDQVITDDGRVGKITSFCDCESCKKRGFYEPNIKMEIGDGHIYITNTDKRNGFKNFYSIGNQVFGNIDEQYVLDAITYKKDQIQEVNMELFELNAQLNVVRNLKK